MKLDSYVCVRCSGICLMQAPHYNDRREPCDGPYRLVDASPATPTQHAFVRFRAIAQCGLECIYCGCAAEEKKLRACMFLSQSRRVAWQRVLEQRRRDELVRRKRHSARSF